MKMTESDLELLRQYAQDGVESAFAQIVQRHINLVYSAALRQVHSPQLAEEVAQSAFADLARNANHLTPDTILTTWLYQVTRRTAIDVVRRESRRQLREQIATEMNIINATDDDWLQIEPLLDDAMEALDATDRTAVLLRYFENRSFREVGERLGTTDDAAQKRVSRAIDRLRDFFSKRGVAIGASGLVAILSVNAVSAAPVGLALTISTSATIGASTVVATTSATVTKAIAMTALQKTFIAGVIVIAAGAGVYEAHQASKFQKQNETLQESQTTLTRQVEALQHQRDDPSNRLAILTAENVQPKPPENSPEVLKLRGQVGMLRQTLSSVSASNVPKSGLQKMMSDPAMKKYIHNVQAKMIRDRYEPLFKELNLTPENADKFTQLIGDMWAKGTEAVSDSTETAKQNMQDAYDKVNKELQSMLGDTGFARYNDFNVEMPARATLKLLENKLGDERLTADQTSRLIGIVMAEPFDLTHGIAGDWDKAYFGSPSELDEHVQQVQQSQQRILQQAATFLSANQLTALATVQTDSLNAQKTQAAAFVQKR
jgi:RNA polymerase sigma factor (sigma-70 family)